MIRIPGIATSPVGRRLEHAGRWALCGAVAARALALVSSVIVARLLGRETFGQLGIVSSTVAMFQVAGGFALGLTASKHVAELRESDPDRAGEIVGLTSGMAAVTGLLVAGALLLAAPWLAEGVLASRALTPLLRIGALTLFFSAVNGAQEGSLRGFEAFKPQALVTFVAGLVSPVVMVTAVLLGGAAGALWGMVIVLALTSVLNRTALTRAAKGAGARIRTRLRAADWRILWLFSVPAVLSGLMVTPVTWACHAMLVRHADGYAQMGLFSAASQWRDAILFIPTVLNGVFLPLLSSVPVEGGERRRLLTTSVLASGAVTAVAALGISVLSRPIMSSYGAGFAPGWAVLVLLAASGVFAALANAVAMAIASAGRMWTTFGFNSLWAASLLAGSLLLVPNHGAAGLALATALAYLLKAIAQGVFGVRLLRSPAGPLVPAPGGELAAP